jgi:uncharacterized protein YciI
VGREYIVARFVVQTTYADMEKRKEARPRHLAYLKDLLAQGKLYSAGPFADQAGALIIYEAANEEEARSLMNADPYNEAGALATSELREWIQVIPEP